jgi:glutathione S-transferase
MKLYLNQTSPFARWVLICALEWAIADLELSWVNPWEVPDLLTQVNPFSTVPVLQIHSGEALYESSLIVRYLMPVSSTDSRTESLAELQRLALGKMLMETAFRHISLKRYAPVDGPPHPLIHQTQQGLARVLQTMTAQDLPCCFEPDRPDWASLQLAVSLDYLAFRCPSLLTSSASEALQHQLSSYQSRRSFGLTTPNALAAQPQSIALL